MAIKKKHKYIFILGGVMSGVGKGITTSSIGLILQSKGFKINLVKVDPYLNVDAGTMNPTEHGEVFVLDSGLETDQDMGNYERFLDQSLTNADYMTSGMVYKTVIERERNLGYGGKCVEAIPHITGEITDRLRKAAELSNSDISVVEIGGTIGDYQNAMFIEAARVLKVKHPEDVLFIMVSYLPIPSKLGEMKSKPTQNAIRLLNSYGVQADIIVARAEVPLDKKRKEKIAISCSVAIGNVVSAPDIESIYEVPLNFERDKIGDMIMKGLHMRKRESEGLSKWRGFVNKVEAAQNGHDVPVSQKPRVVNIAVIGKYFDTGDFVLSDAYVSVIEAIKFSAFAHGAKPKLTWLSAQGFEKDAAAIKALGQYDGIVVPGGFGETGILGKINVIKFARENKIPYFGLCYGMQLMVIEHARNILGWKDANTAEINPRAEKVVVDIMPEQKKLIAEGKMGGTMRLGSYKAVLKQGTIAEKAYAAAGALSSKNEIDERHRHRYEVNPEYIADIEKAGLVFSGTSPDGRLMEIAELPRAKHPFFLGTQFHPEFKAHPLAPHPLFNEFIAAVLSKKSPAKKKGK